MSQIATVNVLRINTATTPPQIENMASFPETPEGNKAAERKFIFWALSVGASRITDEDALEGFNYSSPDGIDVFIFHSTEETAPVDPATVKEKKERLEYLRTQLQGECISMGGLLELQDLIEFIEPHDVELLEAAGVPESFAN